MSLKDKYSPPFVVTVLQGEEDETTLSFRRMLRGEWREVAITEKQAKVDAEAAKINTEMKSESAEVRAFARARMRDFFDETLSQARVIRDSYNTPDGIERLLQYALIEKDKAEYLDLIDAEESNAIITQIVMMPKVSKKNLTEVLPPTEASSDGNLPDTQSPDGTNTTPTSNPPSPADPVTT